MGKADPLRDPKLQIEWAKRHIGDLERMLTAFFEPNPFHLVQQPEGGYELHKVVLDAPPRSDDSAPNRRDHT